MHRPPFLFAATLLLLVLSLPACKGKNPPGPNDGPVTIQVYKNGVFALWGGNYLQTSTVGSGISDDTASSVPDALTGDTSALELIQTNTSGGAVTSVYGLYALDTYSAPAPVDMSAYYPAGHLQFDLKLGMTPGVGGITYLAVMGSASGQTITFALNTSDYNTTSFVHVSVPVASAYPPSSVSTLVNDAFSISYRETPNGTNQPVLYLDDIKWTTN